MVNPFAVNSLELAICRDMGRDFMAEHSHATMMRVVFCTSAMLCTALISTLGFSAYRSVLSHQQPSPHLPRLYLWGGVGAILTAALATYLASRLDLYEDAERKAIADYIEGDRLTLPECIIQEIQASPSDALRICNECLDLHRKLGCEQRSGGNPTKLFKLVVQLVARSYMQSADEGYFTCFPIFSELELGTELGMPNGLATCRDVAWDTVVDAEYSGKSHDLKRKLLCAAIGVDCDFWADIHMYALLTVSPRNTMHAQSLIECDDLLRCHLGYKGPLICSSYEVARCMKSLIDMLPSCGDELIAQHALCLNDVVKRALPDEVYKILERNLGCYATAVLAPVIFSGKEWGHGALPLLNGCFMQSFAQEEGPYVMLKQALLQYHTTINALGRATVGQRPVRPLLEPLLKVVPDEMLLQITSDLLEHSVTCDYDYWTRCFVNVLLGHFLLRTTSGTVCIDGWKSGGADIENAAFFVLYSSYLARIYYGIDDMIIRRPLSRQSCALAIIGIHTSRSNWIARNAYPLASALQIMCESADPSLRDRCALLLESFPPERNSDASLKQIICQHFPELKAHFKYENASDYEQQPMSLQQMAVRSIRETYATICQDSRNITLDEFIDTMADKSKFIDTMADKVRYPKALREMINPKPGAECLLDPKRAMLALKETLQSFLRARGGEAKPSISLGAASATGVARDSNTVGMMT